MSKLVEIFEHKRREVAQARGRIPLEDLRDLALRSEPPRGFIRALRQPGRSPALIAEVKKASPSQGLIRESFDPVQVATAYQTAGAACLSVLTDEKYFAGSPENLRLVRAATDLPILRKDFIFDSYQLLEGRAWGADAVLLIVAGLDEPLLQRLYTEARELGLEVLVEIHNAAEADVALRIGAELIGINNRDLSTFRTDLSVTEELAPKLRGRATVVSESALQSAEDVRRVSRAGADAVLIGTAFCSSDDIEGKVREVMGW